jgi:hypothetical protein
VTTNKDLLWGAKPIAAELNVTVSVAYRLLEQGRIPEFHGRSLGYFASSHREHLARKISAGFKIGEAKRR